MIRELRKADVNIVADIWLDTNIKAHYFISAQYSGATGEKDYVMVWQQK